MTTEVSKKRWSRMWNSGDISTCTDACTYSKQGVGTEMR